MSAAPTRVLVHGAWGAGFVWDAVASHLDAQGKPYVVVDQMPTSGPDPAALGTTDDDADHLRAILDGLDGPARLVGHSWGGWAVTEVAGHPAVESSVYVAAFWPRPGQSVMDLFTDHGAPTFMEPHDDRSLRITDDVDLAHAELAADVSLEEWEAVHHRLGYLTMASQVVSAPAVERHDETTYVVCTEDRAIVPALQEEMAARADHVVHLDCAHCPNLSRPEELATLL